ncbi:MAG: two-component system sensor histidine kinase/response regulator [Nitrospinales bacterium]|jgi:two-component system sensor histidine kinase/response regulator
MENKDFDMAGMKVLIVDDTPTNLDVLQKVLANKGLNISVAPNGEVALKIVPSLMPDLILLDLMMPGIDGFETCEKLKSDPISKDIPVIFLTAKTDTTNVVQGFLVGGIDYITKPFFSEEVLVRIRTQLQLRKKNKELEMTQSKLERSNQDLQEFASVVSHDLKEPLRNLFHLGDFLKQDYGDQLDEKGQGYINKMSVVTNRMSQLIDSLLEFSQITEDTKPFETLDLKEIIQRVIENLQEQIKETNGVIHIGDLPAVKGEPSLFLQLFQNLIANALKFKRNEESPVIKIYGQSPSNEFCNIFVEDNGIGIDEKYAEKIFLPLKRLVSKEEYKGSGIGLATCKKIIDYHVGTICFKSLPGKGTKFIISLPINF